MTTNVQTAEEWGQVIDNLDTIKKSVLTQVNGTQAIIGDLTSQRQTLSEQYASAYASGDMALVDVIQDKLNYVNTRLDGASVTLTNLSKDLTQIDTDLNYAFNQQGIAESGPPIANSTTPPASDQPGDPTEVELEPELLAEDQQDIDEFVEPDITSEISSSIQQLSDDETDLLFDEIEEPLVEDLQTLSDDELDKLLNDEVDINAPLEEPPDLDPGEYDEFAGLDEAIAANENALQEPPLLSDEEVDEYLNNLGDEEIDLNAPLQEPPNPDPSEYDEFAGLDDAVAENELALREPPELSDEEVDEYLNNIEPPEAPPELTEEDIIGSSARGTTGSETNTKAQPTEQSQQFTKQEDWRVRLSLSPGSTYLYNAKPAGILEPLAATNGVIFPYTPSIQINYAASYDATDLTHSNYKVYQYKNSSIDNISISCDFTAQDTFEANYLLAVIHFFRTVTKMFYGQDQNPKRGTPPPLCFLTGLGAFQFNEHPIAITSFSYNLPTDVDYIRAGQITSLAGVNLQSNIRPVNSYDVRSIRLGSKIKPGGSPADPEFGSLNSGIQGTVTYVPTKMQIQLTAVPMMSRNDVSNNFSVKDYASGKLLRGIQNVRGGFW